MVWKMAGTKNTVGCWNNREQKSPLCFFYNWTCYYGFFKQIFELSATAPGFFSNNFSH